MAQSVATHLSALLLDIAMRSDSAASLQPIWARLVGPVLAQHTSPVRLVGGELTVKCKTPAWVGALSERREELLRAFSQALGAGHIRDFRWELG
jgi:predicted nucleic acid-binding Zn ribbon protein